MLPLEKIPPPIQNLIYRQRLADSKLQILEKQLLSFKGNKAQEEIVNFQLRGLNTYTFTNDSDDLFKAPMVDELLVENRIPIGLTSITETSPSGLAQTYEIPVLMAEEQATHHILIAGATGSSKSALASTIAGNFSGLDTQPSSWTWKAILPNTSCALELPLILAECGTDFRINLLDFDERLDTETVIEDFYNFTSPPCWFNIRSRTLISPNLRILIQQARAGNAVGLDDLVGMIRNTKGIDPILKQSVLGKLEILQHCRLFTFNGKTDISL